jgi:hypothetical protein
MSGSESEMSVQSDHAAQDAEEHTQTLQAAVDAGAAVQLSREASTDASQDSSDDEAYDSADASPSEHEFSGQLEDAPDGAPAVCVCVCVCVCVFSDSVCFWRKKGSVKYF